MLPEYVRDHELLDFKVVYENKELTIESVLRFETGLEYFQLIDENGNGTGGVLREKFEVIK